MKILQLTRSLHDPKQHNRFICWGELFVSSGFNEYLVAGDYSIEKKREKGSRRILLVMGPGNDGQWVVMGWFEMTGLNIV